MTSVQSSLDADEVDLSGLVESIVDSDEEDLAESIDVSMWLLFQNKATYLTILIFLELDCSGPC